jgi:hypothetical protein
MPKELTIVTDVLVPDREFKAEYTATNPAQLLGIMLEMMKKIWRTSSSNVFADKIKWDVTGEKVEFYGEWRARRKEDIYTTLVTRIVAQGEQDPKTKEGKVKLKLRPMLETNIKAATSIDAAMRQFYISKFYKKQVRKYVEVAKKRINDFDSEVRTILEVGEREAGSRPGSMM